MKNNLSVLATDFSEVDKDIEQYMLEREKKENVYIAYGEYILCLKNSLKYETDIIKRNKLEKQIKTLEKEKEKYYVPSILGESRLSKVHEPTKKSQEKSSCKLLKKLKNRFKK